MATNRKYLVIHAFASALLFFALPTACSSDSLGHDGDCTHDVECGDPEDTDRDGDSEGEGDSDGDSEGDGDSDGDGDSEGEGDSDGDGDDDYESGVGKYCTTTEDCAPGLTCHRYVNICSRPQCRDTMECSHYFFDGSCLSCDPVDHLCYPRTCTSSLDCCPFTACIAGLCLDVSCPERYEVVIAGGDGLIAESTSLQLHVTVLNEAGARLEIFGEAFTWESDNRDRVSVDGRGRITGGLEPGEATITASLVSGEGSGSVRYRNFPAVEAGNSRVVLLDALTGKFVDGARVHSGGVEQSSVNGVALFEDTHCATAGCDFHIIHEDYGYVSLVDLQSDDVLIHLTPNRDISVSAGVRGHADFTRIPRNLRGDLTSAVSGFPFPQNPADWKWATLLGETVMVPVRLGSVIDDIFPFVSGKESHLDGDALKDGFAASGQPGENILWSLGGYSFLTETIELFSLLSGGLSSNELETLLYSFLPLQESYYHGLRHGIVLEPIARIEDIHDLNGNGRRDDRVPDYATYPELVPGPSLSMSASRCLQASRPRPTAYGDQCLDYLFTMIGALHTDTRTIIPLNWTWSFPQPGQPGCEAEPEEPLHLCYAPQHSRISGFPYRILTLAIPSPGELFVSEAEFWSVSMLGPILPFPPADRVDHSGVIQDSSHQPGERSAIPAFLSVPEDAEFQRDSRSMSASAIPGAAFHRAVFTVTDETLWQERVLEVYWPGDGAGFSLPQIPAAEARDLSAQQIRVQAMETGDITYQSLFTFDGTRQVDLGLHLTRYSTRHLPVVD